MREIHLQLNTAYYIFLIEINQLPKLAYNLSLPEGDKPTTDRLRLSEINLQSNSTKATSARENNHTTKPSYIRLRGINTPIFGFQCIRVVNHILKSKINTCVNF